MSWTRASAFITERRDRIPWSPLTRAAWRAVKDAGDHGAQSAIEAVWRAWLRHPDDEAWDLLSRWRGADRLAADVFAAATDPARPAVRRYAIGEFCVRRGVVPATDAERALFFVLTGQPEQHRAADPDGAALAAAYQSAGDPVRRELRRAITEAGDLALVHAVVKQRPETPGEREYLAAELARRGDWPRLWRLALDLPLAEAVTAARQLPSSWRPDGEGGRQLLTRLAAHRRKALENEPRVTMVRSDSGFYQCDIVDGFLAPDGSAIAVGHGDQHYWNHLLVHTLPSGDELTRFTWQHSVGDEDNVAVSHWGVVYLARPDRYVYVIRHVAGCGTERLAPTRSSYGSYQLLAGLPTGFVVVQGRQLFRGTGEYRSALREVTPLGIDASVKHLVSEPVSGRVAIATGSGELLILDPDFEIIDRVEAPGELSWLGFCGPDHLLTLHARTQLRSWRVGSPTAIEATRVLESGHIQPLAFAGLVVAGAAFLDAGTLEPAPPLATLGWIAHRWGFGRSRPYLSPGGDYGAWKPEEDANAVEVHDLGHEEVAALVRRPLSEFGPADLVTVRNLAQHATDRKTIAALGLLRACLEYRFAAEVAIGGVSPAPGADDIALADGSG